MRSVVGYATRSTENVFCSFRNLQLVKKASDYCCALPMLLYNRLSTPENKRLLAMRGHSQSTIALGLIGSFRLALLPLKRNLYAQTLLAEIDVVARLVFRKAVHANCCFPRQIQ